MDKDTIQIIIVEDDKSLQDMYKASIEEFNIENENYKIECSHLENDNEIPIILYNQHIDAIIIDLDWGTGSQENEGNRLVKKIYKDCRVPIFIVSGNLQLLEEEYTESPIFKKYQRDEVDNLKLLKEIENLYKTGYTNTLGNQSEIDNMLSKVFWEHMTRYLFWMRNIIVTVTVRTLQNCPALLLSTSRLHMENMWPLTLSSKMKTGKHLRYTMFS